MNEISCTYEMKERRKMDNKKYEAAVRISENHSITKTAHVKEELYRLEMTNRLNDEVDEAIGTQLEKIKKYAESLGQDDKDAQTLLYIKYLIGYCKRKANIVLSSRRTGMYEDEVPYTILAGRLNNRIVGLTHTIEEPCVLTLLDMRSQAANLAYQHGLTMMYLYCIEHDKNRRSGTGNKNALWIAF